MKPAQSTIDPSCLQEMLESATNASDLGQRQYFTPPAIANALGEGLTKSGAVLDISIGDGSLTHAAHPEWIKTIYGIDIDPRSSRACAKLPVPATVTTANITHWHSIASELPVKFPTIVCNPPFSLKWPCAHLSGLGQSDTEEVKEAYQRLNEAQDTMDSTIASMLIMIDLLDEGGTALMVANKSTLDRLASQWEMLKPFCYLQVNIEAEIFDGIAQWHNEARGERNLPTTTALYFSKTHKFYNRSDSPHTTIHVDTNNPEVIKAAIKNEFSKSSRLRRGPHIYRDQRPDTPDAWYAIAKEYAVRFKDAPPEYNISLVNGKIVTHLTTFERIKGTYTMELIRQLEELSGKSPAGLVVQSNSRTALKETIEGGMWKVHPDVMKAVNTAIRAYESERAPFFQPNETMCLGWVDENAMLTAKSSDLPYINEGESYQLRTFTEETTWDGEIISIAGEKEKVKYRGNELVVCLVTKSSSGSPIHHSFHVRRDERAAKMEGKPQVNDKGITIYKYPIESIFQHFNIPVPMDIAAARPEQFAQNEKNLATIEEHIRRTLNTA